MQTPLDRMADFDLSDEQREVRRAVREFAEKEILPHVERHEREARYPLELIAKLPALGLMGPLIPEKYGGSYSDVLSYGVICEELARIDWVIASVVSVSNSLVASSILRFGTEAQKREFLTPLASGKKLGCFALSEPDAGSDVAAIRTTARPVDAGIVSLTSDDAVSPQPLHRIGVEANRGEDFIDMRTKRRPNPRGASRRSAELRHNPR
jgi:alkylation response protein AidB-like acyl-CoA dehydrogenase